MPDEPIMKTSWKPDAAGTWHRELATTQRVGGTPTLHAICGVTLDPASRSLPDPPAEAKRCDDCVAGRHRDAD